MSRSWITGFSICRSGASSVASGARLGNVAGALLLTHRKDSGEDRMSAASVADCFDRLFEETLLVGGAPPSLWPGARVHDPRGEAGELHSLLAAWEASTSERVVVSDSDEAGRCADLMLALTAWPESDAVLVSDAMDGEVLCSAFRRERCVEVARETLGAGEASRSAFLVALARSGETQEISVDRLGLSDWRQGVQSLREAD